MHRKRRGHRPGRFRILLLRYEDIKHWDDILSKYFPETEKTEMVKVNVKDKKLSAVEDDLRARLAFTEPELERHMNGDTIQCEARHRSFSQP